MDVLGLTTTCGSVSAAALALLVHRRAHLLGKEPARPTLYLLSATACAAALFLVAIAYSSATSDREWDFLAFYIPARVASEGGNFYDSVQLQQVERPFAVTRDFERQVLEGGSSYPPPSMLLFAPFGLLPFRLAYAAWFLVQGVALLLALRKMIGLLARPKRILDQLLIAILVLTNVPAFINVSNAQTQFLLLLLLSWFLLSTDSWGRGGTLAVAILLKPYVAILLLPVLRYQQRQTLIGAIVSLIAASASSALIWGTSIYSDYLHRAGAFPLELYAEPQNQSWAGLLTRRFLEVGQNPLEHPVFWAGAVTFMAVCLWRLLSRPQASRSTELLVLLTGLLIYPATLKHYLVVLVLPLLYLWFHQQRLRIRQRDAMTIVLGVTLLAALDRGEHGFWGLLATWGIFAVLAGGDAPEVEITKTDIEPLPFDLASVDRPTPIEEPS